jgi:hypothetical protein
MAYSLQRTALLSKLISESCMGNQGIQITLIKITNGVHTVQPVKSVSAETSVKNDEFKEEKNV